MLFVVQYKSALFSPIVIVNGEQCVSGRDASSLQNVKIQK